MSRPWHDVGLPSAHPRCRGWADAVITGRWSVSVTGGELWREVSPGGESFDNQFNPFVPKNVPFLNLLKLCKTRPKQKHIQMCENTFKCDSKPNLALTENTHPPVVPTNWLANQPTRGNMQQGLSKCAMQKKQKTQVALNSFISSLGLFTWEKFSSTLSNVFPLQHHLLCNTVYVLDNYLCFSLSKAQKSTSKTVSCTFFEITEKKCHTKGKSGAKLAKGQGSFAQLHVLILHSATSLYKIGPKKCQMQLPVIWW